MSNDKLSSRYVKYHLEVTYQYPIEKYNPTDKLTKQSEQTYLLHLLHNGTSIFFDDNLLQLLHKHKIHAKPIGMTNLTKNHKTFLNPPYLLDYFATHYLHNHQTLINLEFSYQVDNYGHPHIDTNINSYNNYIDQYLHPHMTIYSQFLDKILYKVYEHLQGKYYMIKGHKFGCDFMLYEEDPNTCHATYLLFVNQPLQLNHMTRLADICKKRCLFVDDDNGNLSFYELSREKGYNIRGTGKRTKNHYSYHHIVHP